MACVQLQLLPAVGHKVLFVIEFFKFMLSPQLLQEQLIFQRAKKLRARMEDLWSSRCSWATTVIIPDNCPYWLRLMGVGSSAASGEHHVQW